MDDYNVLVRGQLTQVTETLTELLGDPIDGRTVVTFLVDGQEAAVYDGADYEDDAVGPLSTYPITIAMTTGTNREMEAGALRLQQILCRFDTLALRNLSTLLLPRSSAAA